MCELTPEQQSQLDAAMAADAGLADGLRPLLAGDFGAEARDLMLGCLSRRFAGGWPDRTVPLLALADAIDLARSGADAACPKSWPRKGK
jgi:hypothetical protein